MKKERVLLVFCMLMFEAICAESKEVYVSSGKTPNIPMLQVVGTNCVQLGTIADCIITNVPFRLVNTGNAPVKIVRLIPTCSCITATSSSTNDVPPGGEVVVRVTMDPRTVHGAFDRGLWVCANDTDSPYLELKLRGTVAPLFSGLPDDHVFLKLEELGRPYTNRFTFTANVPGLSLGQPQVVTNSSGLTVSLSVAPNQGENPRYALTVITTASVLGRHVLVIQMPVLGRDGVAPLLLRFRGMASSSLTAIPQEIGLTLGSQPQTYRVILRGGRNAKLSPSRLEWEPKMEGVRVNCVAGRSDNEVLVRIEVSPEAAETLYLSKKNATILLSVPGFGSVNVPFVSEADSRRGRGGQGIDQMMLPFKTKPLRF